MVASILEHEEHEPSWRFGRNTTPFRSCKSSLPTGVQSRTRLRQNMSRALSSPQCRHSGRVHVIDRNPRLIAQCTGIIVEHAHLRAGR
jgi:hypothetical protein